MYIFCTPLFIKKIKGRLALFRVHILQRIKNGVGLGGAERP
jgi:hypothetical protein